MKKQIDVALVRGDGAAPDMMAVACEILKVGAEMDGITVNLIETPAGWNAYETYGDTMPAESLKAMKQIGTVFFGGVGDPAIDKTLGAEHPQMLPERRALLAIREELQLLLNYRPVIYYPFLSGLANVRPERITRQIEQHWLRYLLQDSYFGNSHFLKSGIPVAHLGVKELGEVTGDEQQVADMALYTKEMLEKYLRAAFAYAHQLNLPVISIDKSNVMPRYLFWRKTCDRIRQEFPEVEFKGHQLVDSANMLLFYPEKLRGVIICGNEHGDILSDGAVTAMGSMGLMCSSAINPTTGEAMFESGAGTAPTLAGQDVANPIGRSITSAMLLEHMAAKERKASFGGRVIKESINNVLRDGYRTADIFQSDDNPDKLLGTKAMGGKILEYMNI